MTSRTAHAERKRVFQKGKSTNGNSKRVTDTQVSTVKGCNVHSDTRT